MEKFPVRVPCQMARIERIRHKVTMDASTGERLMHPHPDLVIDQLILLINYSTARRVPALALIYTSISTQPSPTVTPYLHYCYHGLRL